MADEVTMARETAAQITGKRIQEVEVAVPVYRGREGDRVHAIRLNIEGVGWVIVDPWNEYADDAGIDFRPDPASEGEGE